VLSALLWVGQGQGRPVDEHFMSLERIENDLVYRGWKLDLKERYGQETPRVGEKRKVPVEWTEFRELHVWMEFKRVPSPSFLQSDPSSHRDGEEERGELDISPFHASLEACMMAIPHVFVKFLDYKDAISLRSVSHGFRNFCAMAPWNDTKTCLQQGSGTTGPSGLMEWRNCFPKAVGIRISQFSISQKIEMIFKRALQNIQHLVIDEISCGEDF
jgi:hypothetical protein